MKNKNLLKLTLICSIALISSCSIQKRTFRSGYHVEWNKNYSSANSKESAEQNIIANNDNEQYEQQANSNVRIENEVLISSEFANNEIELDMDFQSDLVSAPESKYENAILPINKINSKKDIEQNQIESGNVSNSKITSNKSKKQIKSSNAPANGGKVQIVALILCILLGLIGIHRFYLGYTGLGILYLLTFGLFGIGWIIDLVLLIIPNGLTPKGRSNYKE
jgi:CRISPR/Cas system CSM-associated protein Csm3 (group 7 of RAMP superfamily)